MIAKRIRKEEEKKRKKKEEKKKKGQRPQGSPGEGEVCGCESLVVFRLPSPKFSCTGASYLCSWLASNATVLSCVSGSWLSIARIGGCWVISLIDLH
jgi:hypothetical protein